MSVVIINKLTYTQYGHWYYFSFTPRQNVQTITKINIFWALGLESLGLKINYFLI